MKRPPFQLKQRKYIMNRQSRKEIRESRKAIIVDIDGTIATHYDADGNQLREHHDYAQVGVDLPIPEIIQIVQMYEFRGYHIIIVSGRMDHCREETINWLIANDVEFDELFMRKFKDFRPDNIVKHEIFDQNISEQYDIEFVLDDRDRVVRMWRDLGLRVLQVADGDF
jgi:acid phosphatase class B